MHPSHIDPYDSVLKVSMEVFNRNKELSVLYVEVADFQAELPRPSRI